MDLSPVISIMAIILLIIAVASAMGRIFTKIAVVGGLSFDDYAILGAAVMIDSSSTSGLD